MVKLPSNMKIAAYSALTGLGMGLASFANIEYSDTGVGRIGRAAGCLCGQLMAVLPVISMLMVIGAGVVYAAGQMVGAETRARANTWATAMLVGAVIGILITVVAPGVLNVMYGQQGGQVIEASICDVAYCD